MEPLRDDFNHPRLLSGLVGQTPLEYASSVLKIASTELPEKGYFYVTRMQILVTFDTDK